MGIIRCEKHGDTSFYDACEHVHADLRAGRYPKMVSFPCFETKICEACTEMLDLSDIPDYFPEDIGDLSDEQINHLELRLGAEYERIPNRGQFCVQCAEELRMKTNSYEI
ncbi:MAG: hypothetical protein AAGB22_14135, partial [Bacteroidota bacterium]